MKGSSLDETVIIFMALLMTEFPRVFLGVLIVSDATLNAPHTHPAWEVCGIAPSFCK